MKTLLLFLLLQADLIPEPTMKWRLTKITVVNRSAEPVSVGLSPDQWCLLREYAFYLFVPSSSAKYVRSEEQPNLGFPTELHACVSRSSAWRYATWQRHISGVRVKLKWDH